MAVEGWRLSSPGISLACLPGIFMVMWKTSWPGASLKQVCACLFFLFFFSCSIMWSDVDADMSKTIKTVRIPSTPSIQFALRSVFSSDRLVNWHEFIRHDVVGIREITCELSSCCERLKHWSRSLFYSECFEVPVFHHITSFSLSLVQLYFHHYSLYNIWCEYYSIAVLATVTWERLHHDDINSQQLDTALTMELSSWQKHFKVIWWVAVV